MDPIREYAAIACILAVLAFAGWGFHKVEMIGENKVVAAQKAADEKEAAHVAQVQHDADLKYAALEARFTQQLGAGPKPGAIPARLCWESNLPANAGSNGTGAQPGSNGPGGPGSGVAGDLVQGPDITPDTEALLNRLGAKLSYLQGYVVICQNAGLCAK
jgi:hypothetical protein